MKKVIHKWFWLWDFDKEEKWLAEMSAKGMQLVDIGYCRYTFEEGAPNEYDYRLELLEDLPTVQNSIEYIRFMEETGAEYLGSVNRWVYFRKRHTEQGFDLFSDLDSRLKHVQRILLLASILTIVESFALLTFVPIADQSPFYWVGVALLGALTLFLVFGLSKILGIYRALQQERNLHE